MKTAKQNTLEVTGTVTRFTRNRHNDIDGVIIDKQGELVEIKFPPHTARYIREVASEGNTVRLYSAEKAKPPRPGHRHKKANRHLISIENSDDHRQFHVESMTPPHPPETGRLVAFTIPRPQYTRGEKSDEITGVIFEDKYIHLHPEEYPGGQEALTLASVLHVKAKQRKPDAGFVNADGYIVYHAHSVSAEEK